MSLTPTRVRARAIALPVKQVATRFACTADRRFRHKPQMHRENQRLQGLRHHTHAEGTRNTRNRPYPHYCASPVDRVIARLRSGRERDRFEPADTRERRSRARTVDLDPDVARAGGPEQRVGRDRRGLNIAPATINPLSQNDCIVSPCHLGIGRRSRRAIRAVKGATAVQMSRIRVNLGRGGTWHGPREIAATARPVRLFRFHATP